MTVKNLRKQLAAAIAMTLVATVALGSSTYAWFAVNGKVTATGMNFNTSVSNNLFIANDDSTTKALDSAFYTTMVQPKAALLEPVSTVNGENFFFAKVDNVVASGDTKTNTWLAYDHANTVADADASTTTFDENYGTTGAKGYVEYKYQLKAITGSATPNIYLTELKLTYGGDSNVNDADVDANKAFRVAVFAQDITPATAAANELKAIYTGSGSANFDPGKAVDSVSTLGTVTYNAAMNLTTHASTDPGYSKGTYYLITVRLWLEGEDTTCNNTTFANLNDRWRLDMAWALADTTNTASVTNITLDDTATGAAVVTAKVDMTSATVGETLNIAGTDYYKLSVQFNGKDAYTDTATQLGSTSKVFTYDGGHMTEVTNQCDLPTN